MGSGLKEINNWSPIISKLIWPLFIVIILMVYSTEVSKIYNLVLKEVIAKGRSVELGSIFKLGERAEEISINEIGLEDISIKAIGSSSDRPELTSLESTIAEKKSVEELERLKAQLEKSPLQKMDVLLVTDKNIYSGKALKVYISTLGVRFVVFQKSGEFDKWIYASNLIGQLQDDSYSYDELTSSVIVGASSEHVKEDNTALQVLEKMKALRINSLPVIDKYNRLMFFTDRGEILSTLISTIILTKEPST